MSSEDSVVKIVDKKVDWDLRALEGPHTKYSAEIKIKAATVYVLTGSVSQVMKATNLPQQRISDWKTRSAWWDDAVRKIRKEKQDSLDSIMTDTIHSAMDEIVDRIKEGDVVRDTKTGDLVRVPMKGKELAVTAAVLFDKRSLIRGDATSISTKKQEPLKEIEDKLKEFAKLAKEAK